MNTRWRMQNYSNSISFGLITNDKLRLLTLYMYTERNGTCWYFCCCRFQRLSTSRYTMNISGCVGKTVGIQIFFRYIVSEVVYIWIIFSLAINQLDCLRKYLFKSYPAISWEWGVRAESISFLASRLPAAYAICVGRKMSKYIPPRAHAAICECP